MVMNGFDTNFDFGNEVYAVNSIGFHYAHRPIKVKRGELVRIYLVNIVEFDPINSFHVHANFFHYFPTGTSLQPLEFTDTIMQAQGQRGILELRFPYRGRYMFHAHKTEFAELGWLGLLRGGLMEARGAVSPRAGSGPQLPAWVLGLIPLALIAAAIAAFALLGAPGLGERNGPPVEELAVERTVLRPGEIELTVRNDGPDPVDIAQVSVNDAYVEFAATSREVGRLGSTTITVPYDWIEGEAYEVFLLTSTGGTIDHAIDVAAETPEADSGFFGLMALLGIYVGVIPVALGMLWLPFVRRIDRRWVQLLLALTIGLLAFLAIDAVQEGVDVAGSRPAGAWRRRARLRRGAGRLPAAGWGRRLHRPAGGERAAARGRRRRHASGAADRDRDRPAQPRRGAGDRLRLRGRRARAGRLPRRRLRDPQHDRGAGDRRAARRGTRRRPVAAGRARPGGGRSRDPRRLDRRRRLQRQPRRLPARRRGGGDRAGDPADRPLDPRWCRTGAASAQRRRDPGRLGPDVRDRAAGERLMASRGTESRPERQPHTEAIEDYAKAIYALSLNREGPVTNGEVAERLRVTPATATSMLKRLDGLGLVDYLPYKGVTLTEAGEKVALEVIRHHRLIESYLSEALGMPSDRVHDEAEVLEHYISEELELLIAAKLGEPSHDPHGTPIPGPDLQPPAG